MDRSCTSSLLKLPKGVFLPSKTPRQFLTSTVQQRSKPRTSRLLKNFYLATGLITLNYKRRTCLQQYSRHRLKVFQIYLVVVVHIALAGALYDRLTGITFAIAVAVKLVGVGHCRVVVDAVLDTVKVAVNIGNATAANTGSHLICVIRTVVTGVARTVIVAVFLVRIIDTWAVVLLVQNTIVVTLHRSDRRGDGDIINSQAVVFCPTIVPVAR